MSELSEAISEMRNMRESYDQLASAAEAYNVGKTQLAAAITAKGVETQPTETYPEMAEKVNAISQETYEINGGEMYAKQLFGVANNDIVPGYWNLYEVMAQLLSDGRLVNYGGILLAEYYKGYDSLALSGAGAGGAYVVSEKDENGQFKMYTNDTTHTWATEDDGKGNRWVAYCFADEYHDFQITDTNTSPRSIFIGRKVGTISCLVNTRISDIVVPNGHELVKFVSSYPNLFGRNAIIRNLANQTGIITQNSPNVELMYLSGEKMNCSLGVISVTSGKNNLKSLILNFGRIEGGYLVNFNSAISTVNLCSIQIYAEYIRLSRISANNPYKAQELKEVSITTEDCDFSFGGTYITQFQARVFIKYINNNKLKSVILSGMGGDLSYIELQDGWCKPLTISSATGLTEANMYAYILQRLKQDEADCGDGVTITLGSANLEKLTSAESVQLLDDLTNIYGYTFA